MLSITHVDGDTIHFILTEALPAGTHMEIKCDSRHWNGHRHASMHFDFPRSVTIDRASVHESKRRNGEVA